jgi:hypothetical protein
MPIYKEGNNQLVQPIASRITKVAAGHFKKIRRVPILRSCENAGGKSQLGEKTLGSSTNLGS